MANDTPAKGRKIRVLFLCTGNSCRSQMAEGWTRHLHGGRIDAFSAGVVARGVDPYAVQVMKEAGVDISRQTSKTVQELPVGDFDCVFTLCDSAAQTCPTLPGNLPVVHVPFDDPPQLAAGERDPAVALEHYRRVRDEIRRFVESIDKYIPLPANGHISLPKTEVRTAR